MFYAFENENYYFSQYFGEHYPSYIEESKMPIFAHVQKDKVITMSKSVYSKGKLKQAVEQSNKNIAKYIDRDSELHCFFINYNSL